MLALVLSAPGAFCAEEKDDTVEFVEAFLKADTAQIPPALIPRFMSVDAESLPKKIRSRFEAKKEELNVLRKIAEGRRKAPIRRAGQDPPEGCERKKKDAAFIAWMLRMGFFEITEDESEWLQKRTRCNFCELAEEFSFTPIVELPKKKGGREKNRYLLHMKDPLEAYIGQYRKTGGAKEGTNFFSGGFLGACH